MPKNKQGGRKKKTAILFDEDYFEFICPKSKNIEVRCTTCVETRRFELLLYLFLNKELSKYIN